MSSQKEATLKRIIQSVPPDTPPPFFTEQVMKDVLADELEISPALKSMIRQLPLDIPPAGFDGQVMQQVRQAARDHSTTKPLISANDWLRFTFGAAAFIVITLLSSPDSLTNSIVSQTVYRIVGFVRMTKDLYLLIVVCTSALLILDHVLKHRFIRD